jgi:hypothetical protein
MMTMRSILTSASLLCFLLFLFIYSTHLQTSPTSPTLCLPYLAIPLLQSSSPPSSPSSSSSSTPGTNKLTVAAPSEELLRDWKEVLEMACEGKGVSSNASSDEILMVGTLEKAARTEDNTLRGWRHRYFILKKDSLSYYTARGGEQKGAVLVRGGAVRILSPEEAAGRPFSLELQEGRNLSLIDKSLLDEARYVPGFPTLIYSYMI